MAMRRIPVGALVLAMVFGSFVATTATPPGRPAHRRSSRRPAVCQQCVHHVVRSRPGGVPAVGGVRHGHRQRMRRPRRSRPTANGRSPIAPQAVPDASRGVPPGRSREVQRHGRRRVAERVRRRRRGSGMDRRAQRVDPAGSRGRSLRTGGGPQRGEAGNPARYSTLHHPGRQLLVRHLHAGRPGRSRPGGDGARWPAPHSHRACLGRVAIRASGSPPTSTQCNRSRMPTTDSSCTVDSGPGRCSRKRRSPTSTFRRRHSPAATSTCPSSLWRWKPTSPADRSTPVRPTARRYRLWEVAGTAHADAYTLGIGCRHR